LTKEDKKTTFPCVGRPKKDALRLPLTAKNYRRFLLYSFTRPFYFAQIISERHRIGEALGFFVMNVFLGTLLKVVVVLLLTQNIPAAFIAIAGLLFVIPISIVVFVILVFLLFILSKALGGKGTLKNTLCASSFALPLLIFFQIPVVSVLAVCYSLFLLILTFHFVQSLRFPKSVINILFPFLIFLLILIALGLLTPNYLLSLNII
jgi:hypothetical protein